MYVEFYLICNTLCADMYFLFDNVLNECLQGIYNKVNVGFTIQLLSDMDMWKGLRFGISAILEHVHTCSCVHAVYTT